MIWIKDLERPTKRSGKPLPPGKTTKVRGVTIINTTDRVLYVDPFRGYNNKDK